MDIRIPERLNLSVHVEPALEAELSLLGSIVLDPDVLTEVLRIVGRQTFYSPAHQVMFEALVALHEQKKPIDAITLHDELLKRDSLARVGGPDYIAHVMEAVPSPANAVYYAEIVRDKAVQRAGIAAIQQAAQRLAHPGIDGQAGPAIQEIRDNFDAVLKDLGAKDGQDQAAIEEAATWPTFPQALIDVAPTFRRWSELQRETTEAPEVYHWGGVLTMYGAAVGRRAYTVAASRQFPQMWAVLVGPPGDKKSTVLDRTTDAARALHSELVLRNGWGSAEGFIKSVAEEKADSPTVLLSLSEMATFIRKTMGQASLRTPYSRRGGGGAVGGGASTVCNLYDAACRTVDNSTAGGEVKLEKPLILLLGATVPESAAVLVSDEAIESGLASRFVFFCGRSSRFLSMPPEPDPEGVNAILAHVTKAANYAASVGKHAMTPEAFALYDTWYKRFARERDGLTKRLDAHLLRVALIFAIDSLAGRIEAKHVSAAIAFTEYSGECARFLREHFTTSRLARLEERIVEILRRKPQGLSYRELRHAVGGGSIATDLYQAAIGRLVQRRIVSKTGKLYGIE